MTNTELAFLPATDLHTLIRDKQVSPVEVTRTFLERIEHLDSHLNSYLTVLPEDALRAAKASEEAVVSGAELGPLHGVPVSIKDLEMTSGVRTTGGSLLFEDRVPNVDSEVVRRIMGAGAIMLGKTNTPELGLLGHTENRLGDHCRNPWDTSRTTGGSSGGAGAAIAAGLCTLASGSDGGGSIRIPASFCGIYGIKPTQGRVPRLVGAAAAQVANQFSQSGPMSRTVRDSALLLQVLAGRHPGDPGSLRDEPDDYLSAADRGVQGLRIGWSPDFGYAAVDGEVLEAASKAAKVFESMGCIVEEVDIALEDPFDAFWSLFTANVAATFDHLVEGRTDQLTWYGRESFEMAHSVSGIEYARAVGYLDLLKAQFDDVFDQYDLLLSPTTATTAFPVGSPPSEIGGQEAHWFWGYTPFTFPINMIGHPAASLPCGLSSEGLPIGLHVVGRHGDDSSVVAASAAFEEAMPWAHLQPPIS